ncbi:P-loop containing nucleoside triphosphate hydrolase protein [Trichoderma sp. SZMC 28014]
MSQSTDTGHIRAHNAHNWRPGALLIDKNAIFGGKSLGLDSPITITIHAHFYKGNVRPSWTGFSIEVPYGPNVEDDGFGMCHGVVNADGSDRTLPIQTFKITVRLPNNINAYVEELRPSLVNALFQTDKKMCRLDIRLAPGDRSVVLGYGMPFSHPGEQFEAFINNNAPDSVGVTLIEVLQRREFSFIVASPSNALRSWWTQPLPPPLRYPYGQEHSWSYERYCDLISENKGPQFPTAWSFDNDNDHLTALTQSEIQDVMWVHQEAMKIGEIFFRAYFIAPAGVHPQNCREFYAIVTLGEPFLERYRQPWSRLVNSGSLQLLLFDHNSDMGPAEWNARVAEGFSMAGHPVSNEDLVLQVQRPRPTDIDRRPDFEVTAFDSRWRADNAKELDEDSWTRVLLQFDEDMLRDHERKVKAVNWFSSQSKPFNAVDGEVATPPISEDLRFKMALHRALVHGNGFWKVLGPNQDGEEMDQLSGAMARARLTRPAGLMPRRSLPVVNLIDLPDEHIDALMEEVLRDDNMRLYNYLAERCLGLVLVAAPPGFGKTTLLAVITLAMAATLGKIFAAAPTNVAIDNFAERLDRISQNVVKRLNQGKRPKDKTRARRTFVMRAYKPMDEYRAFINLLRDAKLGDKAAPDSWTSDSSWRLHLSPSFWLLMALKSKAVRELHPDDPKSIHDMQLMLKSAEWDRLRALANEDISWQEYQSGPVVHRDDINGLFYTLLQSVDILCTTPSLSCRDEFKTWKENANGIAVDEAGNMSRPDLYCVWGNTLRPCAMGGDDRQFAPANMTREDEVDSDGNHLNRFGGDARISALEFFRASGWPVFRLRTQLRMANGLFDTCHREVYSDLPFSYGPGSVLSNHVVGRALERYLTAMHNLRPSPPGSLREVFFHCHGTTCIVDEVTRSKRNPDQVENALDFLCGLVTQCPDIGASNIAIISPYKANVKYVESRRREPRYADLDGMQPAATVDSFQGREADIVVVIMGTTEKVGPGFTTDKRRLNVMLSRQRSGLVIFGDINVLGSLEDSGKSKSKSVLRVAENGREVYVRKTMLYSVLQKMQRQDRVVPLPPRAGW